VLKAITNSAAKIPQRNLANPFCIFKSSRTELFRDIILLKLLAVLSNNESKGNGRISFFFLRQRFRLEQNNLIDGLLNRFTKSF
jgi:hypothetical protein